MVGKTQKLCSLNQEGIIFCLGVRNSKIFKSDEICFKLFSDKFL
jgi:hypothetical protein